MTSILERRKPDCMLDAVLIDASADMFVIWATRLPGKYLAA